MKYIKSRIFWSLIKFLSTIRIIIASNKNIINYTLIAFSNGRYRFVRQQASV